MSADSPAANGSSAFRAREMAGAFLARNSFFPTSGLGAWLFWLTLLAATILVCSVGFWLVARRMVGSANLLPARVPLSLEDGSRISQGPTLVITSRSVTGSSSDTAAEAQLQEWQQRALAAEQRAQRADAIVRTGMLPFLSHWLRQNLFRKLIADRADLLENQKTATLKVIAVDERLSRIELQLQQQNQTYERRIERLNKELAAAKEESRALIRAQIAAVKAEMQTARARLLAEAGPE